MALSPFKRSFFYGGWGTSALWRLYLRQRLKEKQGLGSREEERAWSLKTEGLARTESRRVPCPACGAEAGEQCRSARKGNPPRESNHMERVQLAREGTTA